MVNISESLATPSIGAQDTDATGIVAPVLLAKGAATSRLPSQQADAVDVQSFQRALQGEMSVKEQEGAVANGTDESMLEQPLPVTGKATHGLSELAKWTRARWLDPSDRDVAIQDESPDLGAVSTPLHQPQSQVNLADSGQAKVLANTSTGSVKVSGVLAPESQAQVLELPKLQEQLPTGQTASMPKPETLRAEVQVQAPWTEADQAPVQAQVLELPKLQEQLPTGQTASMPKPETLRAEVQVQAPWTEADQAPVQARALELPSTRDKAPTDPSGPVFSFVLEGLNTKGLPRQDSLDVVLTLDQAALPSVQKASQEDELIRTSFKEKESPAFRMKLDDSEVPRSEAYQAVQRVDQAAPEDAASPAMRLSSLNLPDVVKAVQRTLAQRDLEGLSESREVRLSLDDARLPQTSLLIKTDGHQTFVELQSQSSEVHRFLTLRSEDMVQLLAKEAPQVQISVVKDDANSSFQGASQGNSGQQSQGHPSQSDQQQSGTAESIQASDRTSDGNLVDRFKSVLNLNA